jgi:Lactate racemase N-terminal domain
MQITFEVPEETLHRLLDPVPMPLMAKVRNCAKVHSPIDSIRVSVHKQMQEAGAARLFHAGERVAIGVGSRGIGRLPEIVSALVNELKSLGTEPFIIPTMGSHGGATAEGQRDILKHLGVTSDVVGAPIKSQMETVEVGRTADGTVVRIDRLAMEADAIIFVARIKPHTAFRGTYESGLAKMIAIGLGKQEGAAICHARGFGEMAQVVPAMAEVALANAPIRMALAVLENAHDQPYKILALRSEQMLEQEPALLEEAKAAMPSIPFAQLDVLVIDEIGKNISGDGADPNITGRYPTTYASGGPEVSKQVILDLTEASGGNANGVGTADFTTVRLVRKVDLAQTYPNPLTSTVPRPVALPMILPSDRLAFAAALLTCNVVGREPRVMRLKNTLRLDEFWVSSALLPDVLKHADLELLTKAEPLPFDANGDLLDLL